jgi:hypothetical protein
VSVRKIKYPVKKVSEVPTVADYVHVEAPLSPEELHHQIIGLSQLILSSVAEREELLKISEELTTKALAVLAEGDHIPQARLLAALTTAWVMTAFMSGKAGETESHEQVGPVHTPLHSRDDH